MLLAGGSVYVSPKVSVFRARAASPTSGEDLFIQGDYQGHLSSFGETLCLYDDVGNEISCITYTGAPSDPQLYLRVTELHYHPAAPTFAETSAGHADANDFEFIELCNISDSVTLDLTGVKFTNGVIFDFSGSAITSLAPGAIVLVVSKEAAFNFRYPTVTNVAGEYVGTRLNNDGAYLKIGLFADFRRQKRGSLLESA